MENDFAQKLCASARDAGRSPGVRCLSSEGFFGDSAHSSRAYPLGRDARFLATGHYVAAASRCEAAPELCPAGPVECFHGRPKLFFSVRHHARAACPNACDFRSLGRYPKTRVAGDRERSSDLGTAKPDKSRTSVFRGRGALTKQRRGETLAPRTGENAGGNRRHRRNALAGTPCGIIPFSFHRRPAPQKVLGRPVNEREPLFVVAIWTRARRAQVGCRFRRESNLPVHGMIKLFPTSTGLLDGAALIFCRVGAF